MGIGTVIEVGEWDGGRWVKIIGLNIPMSEQDLLTINTKVLADFMKLFLGE